MPGDLTSFYRACIFPVCVGLCAQFIVGSPLRRRRHTTNFSCRAAGAIIDQVTLETPIGRSDSCVKVRPESSGLDDTKFRMLREVTFAPSGISRARRRYRRARQDSREALPKNCNRLQ